MLKWFLHLFDLKNNLACGIRKASDFLMALQLTGAFKRTALPNLQVQAMLAYGRGELGEPLVPLSQINRIIAIGSDRMMAAVKEARHGKLQPLPQPNHIAIASINSPMQCMMKEVCAQCLQKHIDPVSGKETIIFFCLNQDQPNGPRRFPNLATRLKQNTVQEKLANLWMGYLLRDLPESDGNC